MTQIVDSNSEDFNIDDSHLNDKDFMKTRRAYSEIKQIFLDFIPETHFPSFDEWLHFIDNEELHHDDSKLGFVPGTPSSFGGFVAKVGIDAIRSTNFMSGSADEVLSSMRAKAEQNIRSRVRETASKMFEKMEDRGDGGTSKANYQGGSHFNATGLSQALKPIDTSFNTDIPFQGQTRYWQDGSENTGPLFIKSGMPGLISEDDNTNRDSQMWDYIVGPITMEWNTKIASYVTWTDRVRNVMTDVKISKYINRCLAVCHAYYFWRSVIAFTDDPKNRNAGMDLLRSQLTPTDYNNLFNLRREMMQSAIPPFIHEFCFYMNGTYRQSHLPTSPIMKIMPHGFADTDDAYFSGAPATYSSRSSVDLARLFLNEMKEFNNVLSRAIGGWGGIEPFEYTSSPRVDPDYTTFWTNASYVATNANGTLVMPRIDTASDEVVMNTHTDAPDGWISAMIAPISLDTGNRGVGLFHFWHLSSTSEVTGIDSKYDGSKYSSCFMYKDDGAAGFYPVESAQTYQALSGNTYNTIGSSSTFHKYQKFGAERIILTSVNALRQANFQFLDLLYTQDLKDLPAPTAWKKITAGKEGTNAGKYKTYSGRKRGGRGSKSAKSDRSSDDKYKDKDEL